MLIRTYASDRYRTSIWRKFAAIDVEAILVFSESDRKTRCGFL